MRVMSSSRMKGGRSYFVFQSTPSCLSSCGAESKMRRIGALSTYVPGGFRQRLDVGLTLTVIGWNFIAVGFLMAVDEPWCTLGVGRACVLGWKSDAYVYWWTAQSMPCGPNDDKMTSWSCMQHRRTLFHSLLNKNSSSTLLLALRVVLNDQNT